MKSFPDWRKEQDIKCKRSINQVLKEEFNIDVKEVLDNTSKTKIIRCEDQNYLMKRYDESIERIYNFLQNSGTTNVIYPEKLNGVIMVSTNEHQKYYLTPYYDSTIIVPEKQALDLFNELATLHSKTAYPKKLTQKTSRQKIDEISKQLNYKFILIEEYIRSLETKTIDEQTYNILSNYHYILDAKNELIRLQKRIILSIKDEEGVNYSFNHNNPKLDHLIKVKGFNYLTSLEKGKFGIESLDYAKFYIENEELNIDFKKLITNVLWQYESHFYYDYFRYLVLLIYIKKLSITNNLFINIKSFNKTAISIEKYFKTFPDRPIMKEESDLDE